MAFCMTQVLLSRRGVYLSHSGSFAVALLQQLHGGPGSGVAGPRLRGRHRTSSRNILPVCQRIRLTFLQREGRGHQQNLSEVNQALKW